MARPKVLDFLGRHAGLIGLLFVALVIRIVIFQNIIPLIHTDSITYLVLRDLQPVRTPGYPFFIEIIQFFNDLLSLTPQYLRLIVFFQMFLLGMLNTYLVYALSRILTQSKGFGLFMGLMFNLDYFVIGFEFLLLTETLTFTFLALTLLFYRNIFEGKRGAAYLAGLFSVVLLLTRPTFLFLFVVLLGLTGLVHFRQIVKGGYFKEYGKSLAIFLLINLVGIGSWSLRNKLKYDYFGVSLILPYQLGYYTTHFYQKYKMGSDPELDQYGRIFLEEKGMPYNFAHRLSTEFGLPDAKVAGILGKINIKLIKENFGEYLKRVPGAASDYYDYSWYWTLLQDKRLFPQIKLLARFFRMFFALHAAMFKNLVLLLIVTLVVPAAFMVTIWTRKDRFHLLCLLEGVVHYNFLVSVLLTNNGVNNLRFRLPVEPLILLIFYGALFTWGRSLFSKVLKLRGSKR